MTDYDIKVKGNCNVTLYGTDDGTIVVPSTVKFDTDRRKADIEIGGLDNVTIGIPADCEKIELECGNSSVVLKDLTFEQFEMDGKGRIDIAVNNIHGKLDINMADGEASLKVPEGFGFRYVLKGKGNSIECHVPQDQDAENVVEFNGRNSVLRISG